MALPKETPWLRARSLEDNAAVYVKRVHIQGHTVGPKGTPQAVTRVRWALVERGNAGPEARLITELQAIANYETERGEARQCIPVCGHTACALDKLLAGLRGGAS